MLAMSEKSSLRTLANLKTIITAMVVGVMLINIGVFLTGYTAAISAPMWLFEFLPGLAALLIWDSIVVQFLGFGIAAILLSYFANWIFALSWKLFVVVVFVVVQVPLLNQMDFQYENSLLIWLPHWVVLVTCLFCGSRAGAKRTSF